MSVETLAEPKVKRAGAVGQSWMHWTTPACVLDRVRQVGPIALDPCSNDASIVAAHRSIKLPQSGLAADWGTLAYDGLVFVNPPYGRGELAKWMDKCAAEAGRLHLTDIEVIALVPASTGARWFHEALAYASALVLWGPGRISFGNGPPGNGGAPSIDSALIYWGDRPHRFLDAMSGAGRGVLL